MRRIGRFWAEEAGLGTILSIFGVLICLVLAGIAIDTANAWRSREQLQVAADAAAHAGAVALARGGDAETARAAATAATDLNMPTATYGRILRDPYEDVVPLHYDAATDRLGPDGEVNAVSVTVQRSRATGNAVGTLLVKIAGITAWDVGASSVATLVPTRRCNPAAGAYARAGVTLSGEAAVGGGYCLHGQAGVKLQGVTVFDRGSGLSMTDLSGCDGRCSDLTNPGIEAAMAEANLITPDPGEHLRRLAEGFSDPDRKLPEESDFFSTRPRAYDLEPLAEVGVYTKPLRTGDLVRLTPMQVSRLRAFPAGLAYHVSCEGSGQDRLEITGYGMGFTVKDIALVTDCALDLEATVTLTGTLVISTAAAPLEAARGALAGDPEGKCAPGSVTQVFTLAPLRLPSTFTASNAVFLSAGDILVEGHPTGAPAAHAGAAFHAGGAIKLEGSHSFTACDGAPETTVPELKVIRQIALARSGEM